jgi:hypothetical protein
MRNSILIMILAAFAVAVLGLAANASAVCATCTQEGDWSQTADNFIAGKATSEDPLAFGPKVVRQTSSQFNNEDAGKLKASDDSSGTSSQSASSTAKASIDLINISSTPAPVNSGSAVKISAIFRENNADGTSVPANESMITAVATIKDANGKEVGKVSLRQTDEHEYSGVWTAKVAAGEYKVSIASASLQATGNFENALDIEVVEATGAETGNAQSGNPAVKDLG